MDQAIPTVADFMTALPSTVDAGLSLADALERMKLNNIRHLIVTRGGRMTGVVSSRDIGLAAALPRVVVEKTPLSVAVTDAPFTCDPTAPVNEVAAAMEEHRYGCVVVTDNDAPVGIFTTTDALRALRQLVQGTPAERLSPPTHVVENEESGRIQHHQSRAGDSVASHSASPNPNDGTFTGKM